MKKFYKIATPYHIMEDEIPVFGLWWIWLPSAVVYQLLDSLLRRILVPSFLKWFYKSKYYRPGSDQRKGSALPGHTVAILTEKFPIVPVVISIIGAVILYQTSNDILKGR